MEQPELEGTWHLLQDLGVWGCSPDEQTLDLNSEGLGEASWERTVGRKVLSGEGLSCTGKEGRSREWRHLSMAKAKGPQLLPQKVERGWRRSPESGISAAGYRLGLAEPAP